MKRAAIGAILATLMAVSVAGYVYSASIQDTSRDVYYAYAIRHGLFYPLEGPILGDALHLGPAWFYLLALPLWLHESWLATALFVGAIASLKFPLAYVCGSRLVDRGFGVLWAILLAAPGWPSFETLIYFNPNPAAAVTLAALALALGVRDRPPRAAEAIAFGLVCALGLHVHPTTAPVMLLAPGFAASARRAGASPMRDLVLIAAGFAIPFVPYAASQWMGGFPDWKGATGYLEGQVRIDNVRSLALVLWSYFAHGPAMVAMRIGGWAEASGVAAAAFLALPLAGVAWSVVTWSRLDTAARHAFKLLVFLTLAFSAWIALLRPTTPVYFVYALAPFASALLAFGLWRLAHHPAGRVAAVAFAAVVFAAGTAMVVRMAAIVRHGEGVLTSQVLDVKRSTPGPLFADTWFPASGHADLGAFLCARREGVALHGHLAFIVDRSVGVDALLACGQAAHISLGGSQPARPHWVGMSRRFWSRLDSRGACRLGSLELVEASSWHGAGAGLAIPDGRKYFPRSHGGAPSAARTVTFSAPPGHAVLVTNVLHGYQGLGSIKARVAGKEIAAVATNDLSTLFAPASGAEGPTAWVVSFETTHAEGIDVVTFARRPTESSAATCR